MNDIIERMNRRSFATTLAAGAALSTTAAAQVPPAKKGRLKQGVCGGVFRGSNLDFDGQCRLAAELGLVGYDLVGPDRFATLKKYGIVPTLVPGSSKLADGCNDPALHPEIIKNTRELLDAAAAAGAPNLIMLSGNRRGKTDEQGIENTVKLLNAVKKYAEDKGITLCMELLNSKVNHPDYQCDRTWWGVEVCKRVASPRVKLLYDIYHMQIMEGDIIRTIEQNMQWFGHFHTAGNPGRHELSVDQEINYKGVCKKIADMGYTGYICHEYTPVVKTAREALLEAIEACTV
jgi:hydroxypyruvate isomerase